MKDKILHVVRNWKTIYTIVLGVTLVSGALTASFVMYSIDEYQNPGSGRWVLMFDSAKAHNIDPGSGTTGLVNIFTIKHGQLDYDNAIAYDNANVYQHLKSVPGSSQYVLDGETPHSTAYDYVVVCQIDDNGYNTTSSSWDTSLVKAYLNVTTSDSTHTISSELMDKGAFHSASGTDHARINFYLDNSGSGYQLGVGETFDSPDPNGFKLYVWQPSS
jgi:hypothetical protein